MTWHKHTDFGSGHSNYDNFIIPSQAHCCCGKKSCQQTHPMQPVGLECIHIVSVCLWMEMDSASVTHKISCLCKNYYCKSCLAELNLDGSID